MNKLAILLAVSIVLSCTKGESPKPRLDLTIEVKGNSALSYKTSEIDEFGIIKDSTNRKVDVALGDIVIVKVAKISDSAQMRLYVNGFAIDSVSLNGPLIQYEFTQYLTEKFLSKKGVYISGRRKG